MAIKENKDLSKATHTWFYLPDSDRYVTVYLWEDVESLIANIPEGDGDPDMGGCCCTPKFILRYVDGLYIPDIPVDVVGEIHLLKDDWTMEVVAHEVFHFIIKYTNMAGLNLYADREIEEHMAYLHGQLVNSIYKWLWEVNPPKPKGEV